MQQLIHLEHILHRKANLTLSMLKLLHCAFYYHDLGFDPMTLIYDLDL